MTSDAKTDWEFCVKSLKEVSRSFALPISMLDKELCESVTCAYLLCRIVDTIEDDPQLPTDQRAQLYENFRKFLIGKISQKEWYQSVLTLSGSESEVTLARNMDRVLNILNCKSQIIQSTCHQWIMEMCRGMEIYSNRPKGEDGIQALINLKDLCRYCYFVAGTVGYLLTELFILENPKAIADSNKQAMREYAESFGVGLQLVNILKDVGKDLKFNYSFIPRSLVPEMNYKSLSDPAKQRQAHQMFAVIYKKAYDNLDEALEYVLQVPPSLKSVRLFLLIPMWMGIKTLKYTEGNNDIFKSDTKVAISKLEVAKVLKDSMLYAQDNEAIKRIHYSLQKANNLSETIL